jgi:hypothetical protein
MIKNLDMTQISTNPLVNLTIEELNLFKIAMKSNFQVTIINGEVKEDLQTRWSALYDDCIKYCYLNHETITKGYPKMEERTFGNIVEIMINQQIEKI